jgi:hypothetical protein
MESAMIATSRLPLPACFVGALLLAVALSLLPAPSDAQAFGAERVTGSGVAKTESRNVIGFRGIVLGVTASVEVRQGAVEGITLTGDDNIVPLVETVVEDGTLKIRWVRKGNFSPAYSSLSIVIDAKNVDSLTVGGAGHVRAAKLASSRLKVTIGGSGDVALPALDVDTFSITIGGSGTLSAAGRADVLEATLAGSGALSAPKLDARRARVTMQGSGRADVWAQESLDATIAGSGEIVYRGRPQVHQTVVGSGTVVRAADAS